MVKHNKFIRRDFLKSLTGYPILGYFTFSFKNNTSKEILRNSVDFSKVLGLENIQLSFKQSKPPEKSRLIRVGLLDMGGKVVIFP